MFSDLQRHSYSKFEDLFEELIDRDDSDLVIY